MAMQGRRAVGCKSAATVVKRDMLNNLLRDGKAYLRGARIELTAPLTRSMPRKDFAQNHADAGTPP